MKNNFMWGMMVNLGYNMWKDVQDTLRLDKPMWDEYMQHLRACGVNTLLVDIGEGLKYECCPEISAKDAWSKEYFLEEIKKLRDMGFEVVPKLNFSCTHDFWLGKYKRMVSTPAYYDVCRNLIDEVCQTLKPKYFHLGMDEEEFQYQQHLEYITIRQGDMWWNDLYFYQNCVEKNNARAWVWSDYICQHKDEFLRKMPKEILQSNWYYEKDVFDMEPDMPEEVVNWVRAIIGVGVKNPVRVWTENHILPMNWMSQAGYDQVPTGSNDNSPENIMSLTRYAAQNIEESRLLGIMQTAWKPMLPQHRDRQWQAADQLCQAKAWYESRA